MGLSWCNLYLRIERLVFYSLKLDKGNIQRLTMLQQLFPTFFLALNISPALKFKTAPNIVLMLRNKVVTMGLCLNRLCFLYFCRLRNKVSLGHVTVIKSVSQVSVNRRCCVEINGRNRLLLLRRTHHVQRYIVVMVYYYCLRNLLLLNHTLLSKSVLWRVLLHINSLPCSLWLPTSLLLLLLLVKLWWEKFLLSFAFAQQLQVLGTSLLNTRLAQLTNNLTFLHRLTVFVVTLHWNGIERMSFAGYFLSFLRRRFLQT